ncbi:ABC transporter ATP-binding protein, partial [Mycoplasma putrefaciens]
MDDIVFSGSADKPAAKIAEVTLVFDNSQKSFSSVESDLVEITRKFDKSTRESEFFINGQKSKLRDIQDIALETGLTRSSIAIISQGTIANFAEAKPEYKRDVFDDAAGIAKYKKRKRETLLKLEKAAENLNRLEDLANEIARRLPNLERQANKAKKYKDKIAQLQDIELYILTKDLRVYINRIEELREQKLDLDVQIKRLTNEINMSQEEINLIFEENSSADRDLEQLNNQFNQIVQKISNLKVRKKDAELKEEQNASNYDQDQYKAKIIKKEFDQSYLLLESEKQKVNEAEDLINELKEKYDW